MKTLTFCKTGTLTIHMKDMIGVRIGQRELDFLDEGILDGLWKTRSEGIRRCVYFIRKAYEKTHGDPSEASRDL